MNNNYPLNFSVNFTNRLTLLLFICWLMTMISPYLVISFGINDNEKTIVNPSARKKLSIFYSMLTTIFFSLSLATSSTFLNTQLNSLQSGILGITVLTVIFTLLNPQGSIMASTINKKTQRNRFTVIFSCLFSGFLLISIIGFFRFISA